MKMRNCLTSGLCLIAVLGFPAVSHAQTAGDKTTIQEVQRETQELIETLKGYGADQRDKAVAETKEAMEKLGNRIDALETRIDDNWDRMDQAARKKARDSLKSLREQRVQLAEWYGRWKESSASAWERMKEGFSKAYRALTGAWEEAEKEYGTGSS